VGLGIGCAWVIVATGRLIVAILPASILAPINVLLPNDPPRTAIWGATAISAVLLSFAAGAAGAIKAGRVRIGTRVGFWSGVVNGLIGFHAAVATGIAAELIGGAAFPTENTNGRIPLRDRPTEAS